MSENTVRAEALARKCFHPRNHYVRRRLAAWIQEAEEYADMMLEKGYAPPNSTHDSLRTLGLFNKVCPNLVHLVPKPRYIADSDRDAALREYQAMLHQYEYENSQMRIVDGEGKVIQEGLSYTKEEFDVFCKMVTPLLKERFVFTLNDVAHAEVFADTREEAIELFLSANPRFTSAEPIDPAAARGECREVLYCGEVAK